MVAATPIAPARIVNELPYLGSPVIAPDGSHVVYIHSAVDPATGWPHPHLWIAALDGSDARRLTWSEASDHTPTWSPDGTTIAFIRSSLRGNEIALLDLAHGGDPRIVTTHTVAISHLAWSPDGTTLLYTARIDPENPDEVPADPSAAPKVLVTTRLDYKQDGVGFVGDARMQLVTVEVVTGERTQQTHAAIDHLAPSWSPDGSHIAFTTTTHQGYLAKLGILDLASGEITTFGREGYTISQVRWTPDGEALIFAEGERFISADVWMRYDLATRTAVALTGEVEILATAMPTGPLWRDATHTVIHGLRRACTGFWTLDITTGEIAELVQTTWHGYEAAMLPDGSGAMVAMSSLDGTLGLSRIDFADGSTTPIRDVGTPFFAETPAAQWELVTIDRDGVTIEGWLLKPAAFDPARRYPLVLDVHGGPNFWHAPNIDALGQVLATHGILVLRPNPRGSSSYGPDFQRAVWGDFGGEDWRDLLAILDHVETFPYVDGEHIGIYGYSYGGFMASWAITQTDRFRAAIVGAPCFDYASYYGTADIGWFFHGMPLEASPWDDPTFLARSPSEFIQHATTPTLILHGEADENAPIGQSEQLFVSLKKLGVETVFVRYPGASHMFPWYGHPEHRIDLLERALAWFTRFLGESPAPI